MASTGLFLITSVGAAAVIATAVVHARAEIRRLADGAADPFVSLRRTMRRVLAAAVLVALMTMLFYGINYGASLVPHARFVRFWNACFALVPVLVGLALLDAWETHQVVRKQMRRELSTALRKLEEELREAERRLDERAAAEASPREPGPGEP